MNQDDIIRMAREAGFEEPFIRSLSISRSKDTHFYIGRHPCSEEDFMLFNLAFAAGAKAEREECAKCAQEFLTRGRSPLGRAVSDAILAKGQK